jgi:hypothetical protein
MKVFSISLIALAMAGSLSAAQTPQSGQTPQTPQTPRVAPVPQTTPIPAPSFDLRDARETREVFQQLLRQYPPAVGEVLRLDPSLATNQSFLSTYPNLAAFLSAHPEIMRNPSFFLGQAPYFREERSTPETRASEMFKEILAGTAAFAFALVMISVFCWVLKTIIDHRRWLRVSRVQAEVHSKLLDRFTSNQDLLAYVQTSAGRHFLESTPISLDSGPRSISAPVGRILFSIQVGLVAALAGVGLNLVSRELTVQELGQPLHVIGVVVFAVGVGFVLSGLVAYALSRRLGLLAQTPVTPTSDNTGVPSPHA